MLVSTVTPMTILPVSDIASAAAESIAGPPDAWTLIMSAPINAPERIAWATVFGMSWNFMSRNTFFPRDLSSPTTWGP